MEKTFTLLDESCKSMHQEAGDLTLFLLCSPVCCGIIHRRTFRGATESDIVTVGRKGTHTTEAVSA